MDSKLYGYSDDALQDVNPGRTARGPSNVSVAEQSDMTGSGGQPQAGPHESVPAPRASGPNHRHATTSEGYAFQQAAPVWTPPQPAEGAEREPSPPANPVAVIAQIHQQRSSKHLEKVQAPLGITRKSSQQRVHPLAKRSGSTAQRSMASVTSRDMDSSAGTLPSLPSYYKGQQSPAQAHVAAAMHAQPSTGSTTRTHSPSNTDTSSLEKSSPNRSLSPSANVITSHAQESLAYKQAARTSPRQRSASIAAFSASPSAQEDQKAEPAVQTEAAPVDNKEQDVPKKSETKQVSAPSTPQKGAVQHDKAAEAQEVAYPPISKVVQQLKNTSQVGQSSSDSEAPVQVPSGAPARAAPGALPSAPSTRATRQAQHPTHVGKAQESTGEGKADDCMAVSVAESVRDAALEAKPMHLAPDTVTFPVDIKGNEEPILQQSAPTTGAGLDSRAIQPSLDVSTQHDSTQLSSARDQQTDASDLVKSSALEVRQGTQTIQEGTLKSDSAQERQETVCKDIVRTVSATETDSSTQSMIQVHAQAEGSMQGHVAGGLHDIGRRLAPSRTVTAKGAPALPSVAEGAEGTVAGAAADAPSGSRMLASSVQRQQWSNAPLSQRRTTEDTDTSETSIWRRHTDGSGAPSVSTVQAGDATHSVSFPPRSVGTPDHTVTIADSSIQPKVGSCCTLPDASVSVDVQNGAGAHSQVPSERQQRSTKVGGVGIVIGPSPMVKEFEGDSTADILKNMKPPHSIRNLTSQGIPIATPQPPPKVQSNVTPVPDSEFVNVHPMNKMFMTPILTSGYQNDIWECQETGYGAVTPSPRGARHSHIQGGGRSRWWCLCGKL